MTSPIKAITIKQPWAWAITRRATTYAGKDIENRTWTTHYRGPLAIHAGLRWDRAGGDSDLIWKAWAEYVRTTPDRRAASATLAPQSPEFAYGAIVAVADFQQLHHSVTCVRTGHLGHMHPDGPYDCSLWAIGGNGGMYHWELTNVRALSEPVACTGRLGLWDLSAETDSAVRAQLAAKAARR